MFRSVCGGGKGTTSSYDPQIGAAASQSAAVAGKAEDFAENYYNTVVTPMLQQQNTLATQQAQVASDTEAKLGTAYDLNNAQMQQASDRYNQLGIPAEDNYYKMVSDYNAPGQAESLASAAKGDAVSAEASQKGAFMRSLSSLGISANSPAAVSAMSDAAVRNAASEAGAATRARTAAQTLGMTLTSDAANFGRGGTSNVLAFGQAAQGNTTGAFGVANSALSGANSAVGAASTAGNGVISGYNTAATAYGNNLDAYSKLGAASIQAQAANDPMAGIGKLAGTLGSAWIGSDRRIKKNLKLIGHYRNGIRKYSFEYLRDDTPHIGAIAQEVVRVLPHAVRVAPNGFYEVNYAELN